MKKLLFSLLFLLTAGVVFAQQMAVSDAFKKTVDRIARKKIKMQVVNYVSKQDLITGIAARDMIGQIIDSHRDEDKVIRAAINVVTTRLFIGNVKGQVSALIDENPKVLELLPSMGWSRTQLEAYSSLYYYYCERMKNRLYISPYIMEMALERSKIESLRINDNKWTVLVSKNLAQQKRKNIALDIRSLEFFQYLIGEMYFRREGYQARIDSTLKMLANVFPSSGQWADSIAALRGEKTFVKFYGAFIDLMTESAYRSGPSLSGSIEYDYSINDYFLPLLNIVVSTQYSLVDAEELKAKTIQTVIQIFNEWLSQARQDGIKMEYMFSLAATGLAGPENNFLDFTVLDQARLTYHRRDISCFIYTGGFMDPLIKNTVYKEGMKFYLTGLGAQYKSVYFALSGGLPYTDIRTENVRFGLTVGYEIPVWDIME
ncbi:MAG: hypothetical protein KKG02_10675 [Candidatus Edwardsbacteria bacterium]|nr:hypothetical protein [Candidatus Edwardsbacteria bacterium]MBU2594988.1 hypothetical protein [Candidatus Edwardsbacteria bacterium]